MIEGARQVGKSTFASMVAGPDVVFTTMVRASDTTTIGRLVSSADCNANRRPQRRYGKRSSIALR